jgi:uncharacterized protein YbjT (DUF2867 family)
MSNSRHVLVTGATGQQGGSVARALLRNGHAVRGLTRNANSEAAKTLSEQGAQMVEGDFTDSDALEAAARGVDAIFAMTTPFEAGVEAETAQGLAIMAAARKQGVGHLVYSSVANADLKTGIPHFDSKFAVEQAITASDIPYTIIAPVFFMDNLLQPWMTQPGKVSMAMPAERPLQQIAVGDIGAFAAAVIERRESVFGQRFDIAGDELTGSESASRIAAASGLPVRYEGFAPDFLREQSEDMALMFEWFIETGYSVDIASLHRDFPEVTWQDLAAWASAQQWADLVGVPTQAG